MLLDALPDFAKRGRPLAAIGGTVPRLDQDFDRCRFSDRCPAAHADCVERRAAAVRPGRGPLGPLRAVPERAARGQGLPVHHEELDRHFESPVQREPDAKPLLEVRDYRVHFPIRHGVLKRTSGT